MDNIWKSGMYGVIVADAMGVPVEFTSREDRKFDPVIDMRGYGTYNQPEGTWSDDSSMAIATLASIRDKGKIDYKDIMDRFHDWCMYGAYTPFDEVFDIGIATSRAIMKYSTGAKPLESGCETEWDNGNGSLMRILPICLYIFEQQKNLKLPDDEAIDIIHNCSALTHAHLRSKIACGIYYFLVKAILDKDGELTERLQQGVDNAFKYYSESTKSELDNYNRLISLSEFKDIFEDQIRSTGYVVYTLEAAIWCLINTSSYEEVILKAVNLGDDTDTVAAITGGLAGLYYGYGNIPEKWKSKLQKREWIDSLLN
ncbi:ADP-ribosylglycohydrolase family protein [Lachnoanaerobaculum umeaense]|uniref:ADP-ribosylglycohydrolase n=1 Tax=Lachnoanaerobaculum umeaense TaxID=617123 RepID=A0A385PXN4_9FIRM|nr:ADP-ribosylglycohydrolase family protein [Lachnoanaerobaculum umeaense]AYA98860.1 ADP-ribosylglycohydrolase [Lachnoanaerobaculum umeaense]PZW94912.1 ADP-ribosylglycohydrolase [Lachnoanaerobaculum umeaense]